MDLSISAIFCSWCGILNWLELLKLPSRSNHPYHSIIYYIWVISSDSSWTPDPIMTIIPRTWIPVYGGWTLAALGRLFASLSLVLHLPRVSPITTHLWLVRLMKGFHPASEEPGGSMNWPMGAGNWTYLLASNPGPRPPPQAPKMILCLKAHTLALVVSKHGIILSHANIIILSHANAIILPSRRKISRLNGSAKSIRRGIWRNIGPEARTILMTLQVQVILQMAKCT